MANIGEVISALRPGAEYCTHDLSNGYNTEQLDRIQGLGELSLVFGELLIEWVDSKQTMPSYEEIVAKKLELESIVEE